MASGSGLSAWQSKLRPLMGLMLVGLAVFFLVASLRQLYELQDRVASAPTVSLDEDFKRLEEVGGAGAGAAVLPQVAWKVLARLEENALARRYHLAQVTLMSRLWARYLGFVTGMILALVGCSFVLGKLREASSTVNMDASFGKVAVVSTSPGIILAVLGTTLMLATILTNPEIKVDDAPVYLANLKVEGGRSGAEAPDPPGPSAPDDILRELRSGLKGGNP